MAFGFLGLLSIFMALDLLWWRAADRRLRNLRGPGAWRALSIISRIALAVFMTAMAGYLIASRLILRSLGSSEGPAPVGFHVCVYLWHFLILPMAFIWLLIVAIGRRIVRLARRSGTGLASKIGEGAAPNRTSASTSSLITTPTRRQVIAAAALAIPPLAAVTIAEAGPQRVKDLSIDWDTGTVRTNYGWRLRHFDVNIPELPAALDGMTIAHVSDTHIGKFLHRDRLPAIADDINKLAADFVVFTGDLIDLTLRDLPFGINFLRSLKPRYGMAVCEGNHDIMEGDENFENRMRDADVGFILDNQSTKFFSRNGRSWPVQFLAIPWLPTQDELSQAVRELKPIANPDAFRILLAHHPHTFDPASAAGIPLVLSGHTHGGQIMFNERIGIGATRFRYISGQYTKPNSNLIVNNGLGNWFPLRINAPAEIVHLTLKCIA